jgi:hypothetical protein
MSRSGLLSAGSIGASQLVRPSGDATGATDLAAINAALIASSSVTLNGDFVVNAPISLPSSRTLLLVDAKITLASGSNSNVFKNSNQNATGNTDIHIRGLGRAEVDGNAVGQVRQTNFWQHYGCLFVNVQRFSVQDITIGPTHVSAFNTQGGCSDGRFSRITVKLPGDTPNQSAFEIGSGSSNITVEGIRGQTGDDCVAVWAFGTNTGTNTVLHTYTLTLTAAQRSTSDITIRNIDCNIGIVPVRVLGGDGSTIKHVHAYDITNRLTGTSMVPALYVGPSTYVTTDPALGEIDDITMTGYRGPCTELLGLDQACSNVTVIDSQVTKWQKIVGVHAPGAHPIHVRNITIDGVGGTSLQATPSSGTVCQFPAENGSSGLFYPMMVEGLALRNMTLARADAILDNAANITGLHVHNIRVEMMMGTAFRSTGVETGTMDRVSWTVHQGASPQVFSNGPCRTEARRADAGHRVC